MSRAVPTARETAGFAAYFHGKGKWAVRRHGGKRALAIGLSRIDAWKEARRRARGAGLVAWLHRPDGTIMARNTYEREA